MAVKTVSRQTYCRTLPIKYTNGLKKVVGHDWILKVEDRMLWRELGEAYIQQWATKCWLIEIVLIIIVLLYKHFTLKDFQY